MAAPATTHPLKLAPLYLEKVWGGRQLAELGRELPGDASVAIGESWEVADLARTSPTGAGGREARSRIENGAWRGATLREAWDVLGDALCDADRAQPFPLLVKLLDASANLSVQVHPSRAYARSHPGTTTKSEAWYVLAARPGSVLYKGVRSGADRAAFARAVRSGDESAIVDVLERFPARVGDVHYLPSGTCHALGAGIVVAEVQDPSDTTFRVYDWGRTGRALRIDEALECIEYGPCDASRFERLGRRERDGVVTESLVRCDEFTLSRSACAHDASVAIAPGCAVWMVLEGSVSIEGEQFERETIERGRTVVLPARLGAAFARASSGATWLEIGVGARSRGTR